MALLPLTNAVAAAVHDHFGSTERAERALDRDAMPSRPASGGRLMHRVVSLSDLHVARGGTP